MEEFEERRQNERRNSKTEWHLEKNISVGHIITTGLAIISLVTWLMTMDKRVAVLESDVSHLAVSDIHLESQMRDALSKIDNTLDRIENKIDQKQDKR
jgi:hypothetical protein